MGWSEEGMDGWKFQFQIYLLQPQEDYKHTHKKKINKAEL
jgi:hypothetical protein